MSIWTQAFIVNFIVWYSFIVVIKTVGVNTDKVIDNEGVKGWSLTTWTLLTVASFPAWLVYLVVTA